MKTCLHCGRRRRDLKYFDDIEPGDYHDTCVAGIRARIALYICEEGYCGL